MYKFEPLLKQTIWGGDKIIPFKHLDTKLETVGESWEISGVKDNETIVANGEYKGKSLNELVRELKAKLVGKENFERFGEEFPLLIKFLLALAIFMGIKAKIKLTFPRSAIRAVFTLDNAIIACVSFWCLPGKIISEPCLAYNTIFIAFHSSSAPSSSTLSPAK